jgi:hypothetical protein
LPFYKIERAVNMEKNISNSSNLEDSEVKLFKIKAFINVINTYRRYFFMKVEGYCLIIKECELRLPAYRQAGRSA